jgi:hypothetical protein
VVAQKLNYSTTVPLKDPVLAPRSDHQSNEQSTSTPPWQTHNGGKDEQPIPAPDHIKHKSDDMANSVAITCLL